MRITQAAYHNFSYTLLEFIHHPVFFKAPLILNIRLILYD